MNKHIKWVARLAAAGLLCLLAACATPTSPGEVARNWSCKLREMQIRPVFPPREDLQVGDVFWMEQVGTTDAAGYCKEAREFMPIPPYVAYLNLTSAVDAHYAGRPNFPRTTSTQGTVTVTATGVTVASGAQTTDATEATQSPFTNGSRNRTRIVGFPDFMSVHVSKFALGAIVPIDAVLSPIGIARENIREATISIPVAESYSVPAGVIASALANDAKRKPVCEAAAFMAPVIQAAPTKVGQYQIVSEVFYTRAIDVNVSATTAISLSASRSKANAGTTSLPDMTTTGIVTESTISGSVTQVVTKVSEGMMQILQSRGGVPGVSVAYEQGDQMSVKMRRVFDRPVAIGYRSMALTVVPKPSDPNGDCLIVGTQPIVGPPAMIQ